MKIRKKIELKSNKDSTYILHNMGKYFLINKSHRNYLIDEYYQTFICLDKKLNIIRSINKYKEDFSIYNTFPCEDGNRFLLYCNNQDLLIYGNFKDGIIFSIDISNLSKDFISPIFHWNTDTVILSTYNGIFYELNIIDKKIISLTSVFMSKNYKDFYNFWLKTKEYNAITLANFEDRSFIYRKEGLLVFADYKNNIEIEVEEIQNGYHDVIFHKGYFIFVAEESLTITNGEKTYTYLMKNIYYMFHRVRVVNNSKKFSFIVLESHKGYDTKKKIVRYELS